MFARDKARPALVLTMFLCVARLRVLSSGRLDASMRVDGGCETSGFPGPAGEGVAILATWHGGPGVGRSVPVVKVKECSCPGCVSGGTREVSLSLANREAMEQSVGSCLWRASLHKASPLLCIVGIYKHELTITRSVSNLMPDFIF